MSSFIVQSLIQFSTAGDIAFRFLNYLKNEYQEDSSSSFDIEVPRKVQLEGYTAEEEDPSKAADETPRSHVTVCDINQAMLEEGKKKADHLGFTSGSFLLSFLCLSVFIH